MAESARAGAIAVVGLAGRFPGARTLDDFWRNVRDGVEALEEFSEADLDAARIDPGLRANPRYVRRGTPLEDADRFDAAFFGFSPREAEILDPQHRVFLETAWEALEHAGWAGAAAGQSVGVYGGCGANTYLYRQLLANPGFVAAVGAYQLMVGNDKDFLATRVSYRLDLRGPSVTVQTACSTSLVAVVMACRALQGGECDLALAGGVAIPFPQRGGYLHEEGMILSPDGHCRPFDERARGIRAGSGAGVVVLKRLADAVADRDTIHAVILGGAINNDGAGKAGYTAPSVEGQVEAIATAQALAGVDPRSIGYLEAHGTGTPLGDPIEVAALTRVFRAATPDVGFCRLGSLKANLGHLDAAAGVASLIKTVLALGHRELPPLAAFERPNPQLRLEASPFSAETAAAPWPAPAGSPRRAGVSSFGIGGTNAHVVLEEPPAPGAATAGEGPELLVVSARTPAALERVSADLAAHLEASPAVPLPDVAWTLQAGRQPFPLRRAVVARDAAQAVAALRAPPAIAASASGAARPVAFLFSGQGSQHVGMGKGLYDAEPAYREVVDRCAGLLAPHLGLDLRTVLFGPAGEGIIDETRITQPALFVTELALAALWRVRGVTPAAMAGHSLGEYVAAHLAGVLSLPDALALVAARGRLMQSMAPGAMAAVQLAGPELQALLAEVPGVELAAVNAPGLCTVSGPPPAVAALLERCAARGVGTRPLHTSHAFHSAMMEPMLEAFAAELSRVALAPPALPYVSNLTGGWITAAQATSPGYWVEHLRRTVRFEDGVRTLAADPATLVLEVGPGNALASLARITLGKDGARVVASLSHPREQRPDAEAMLEAAGRLWVAGAALAWEGLHRERPRRVPLPTYPFERKRHWVEAAEVARGGAVAASADPGEWLYAPTWTRDGGPSPEARLAGAWLVLADPGPLGHAVARAAREAGAQVAVVEPGDGFAEVEPGRYRVRPGSEADLRAVAGAVRAAGAPLRGAIYLWLAREPAADPVVRGYHALVTLAAALEPSAAAPIAIVAGTEGGASVLDEPIRRPDAALALGPVLTLPAELPGLRMRAVDLQPREGEAGVAAAARELVAEAADPGGEAVVARRAGRRFLRRVERVPAPRPEMAALPLRPGGVYLVTGGLGGIGLAVAAWLARAASARLLLTARTPLPPPEAWDAWAAAHGPGDRAGDAIRSLRAVERAGGEVLVATADVAEEAAMRRALDQARARWGRLDGVFHAAGVPGNERVALRKEDGEVRATLAPKVDGLATLVRLLGDAPLDLVVLTGSITALTGGPGLCDYAAANAVLDAFPESTARPAAWRRVVALDFSAWREVGMATRVVVPADRRRAWEEHLRAGIPPASGVEAIARAIATGRPQLAVTPFDLVDALARARAPAPVGSGGPAAAEAGAEASAGGPDGQERSALSTPYQAPSTEVERRLAAIWSELLGVRTVGVHDDFFQLGGHSLLATRVLARVEESLGARLTLRDVFDGPTVKRLAERIAAAGAGKGGAQDDREELEF